MIIVTGGAGFIGSNIVRGLNAMGHDHILVVDDLSDGTKYKNIVGSEISDYLDKDDFLEKILEETTFSKSIKAVFHQGACSDTTQWDGQYMLRNNYEYSKILLHYCVARKIPFLYASSASVYGNGHIFEEKRTYEAPINVYGYSKFLFDQYVRQYSTQSQIVGLRYFNVYGPGESHKAGMASVAFHLNQQLIKGDTVNLFEGTGGYVAGEQRRDFVYVDDVVKVNLWFFQHSNKSGIYNLGTGRSQTFNDVANAVIDWYGRGRINYVPFPDHLRGHYQSFTEADIRALRDAGYLDPFRSVEEGVKIYLDRINEHS